MGSGNSAQCAHSGVECLRLGGDINSSLQWTQSVRFPCVCVCVCENTNASEASLIIYFFWFPFLFYLPCLVGRYPERSEASLTKIYFFFDFHLVGKDLTKVSHGCYQDLGFGQTLGFGCTHGDGMGYAISFMHSVRGSVGHPGKTRDLA